MLNTVAADAEYRRSRCCDNKKNIKKTHSLQKLNSQQKKLLIFSNLLLIHAREKRAVDNFTKFGITKPQKVIGLRPHKNPLKNQK
jgi:hypothetical protein